MRHTHPAIGMGCMQGKVGRYAVLIMQRQREGGEYNVEHCIWYGKAGVGCCIMAGVGEWQWRVGGGGGRKGRSLVQEDGMFRRRLAR